MKALSVVQSGSNKEALKMLCLKRKVSFSEIVSLWCTYVLPGNDGVLELAMGRILLLHVFPHSTKHPGICWIRVLSNHSVAKNSRREATMTVEAHFPLLNFFFGVVLLPKCPLSHVTMYSVTGWTHHPVWGWQQKDVIASAPDLTEDTWGD